VRCTVDRLGRVGWVIGAVAVIGVLVVGTATGGADPESSETMAGVPSDTVVVSKPAALPAGPEAAPAKDAPAPSVVVVAGSPASEPTADTSAVAEPEAEAVPEPEPEPEVERVTLNFAEGADLRDVLTAYSLQSGRSVVLGPEVGGEVRLHLKDVPWNEALDVILLPYGYSYRTVGDTIVVDQMQQRSVVEAVEPLVSKVFTLRYLDAFGVKEMIESQLTPRGSLSTLTARGQKGWEYGADGIGASDSGKRERLQETAAERESQRLRSRTLVVTDIPSVVERIEALLDQVDVIPVQVLIEARFIEVNTGVLRDIGVEFGTGKNGARASEVQPVNMSQGGNLFGVGVQQKGSGADPAAFRPESTELNNTYPFDAGLSLLFQKLDPLQFEMLLHLLEEEASLNVLSSPRILTLNNQEATIMVGTKYPIIKTEVSGESGSISTSIDYWQDIGIQLNVVPQICEDDNIRMVIHPAVTAQIGTASGRTVSGNNIVPFTDYPILSTRETETQIIIKNAETLAIGGLLKNEEQETIFKVPFLGDIPLLGRLFRRRTTNMKQLDLVIFLTATKISTRQTSLVTEDKTIQADLARREGAAVELDAGVAPQMSADLRALLDLEKIRESGRDLSDGEERLSRSARERRWKAEEELREELIRRLQEQREEQTRSN
jgi:type IV pilus assembly protein PilQ